MGNRCCDGGRKRRNVVQQVSEHVCRATSEVSQRYGTTRYTCQRAFWQPIGSKEKETSASIVPIQSQPPWDSEMSPQMLDSSLSAPRLNPSVARALQIGDATSEQLAAILRLARVCFDRSPADPSNLLEGTLGSAVGCVQDGMQTRWGWRPFVDIQGSTSCDQCDEYGGGATVIEVITDSGDWMLVMRLKDLFVQKRPVQGSSTAKVLQPGDAADSQLAVILQATERCFDTQQGDTHSSTQLYAKLGAALVCVQSMCEAAWGWKPHVREAGSHSCGTCEGSGLGATVIAVDTNWQNWMFVLQLK